MINMQRTFFILSLFGATFLCGCDRETKLNTEKIEILSQRMVQLQESQAKQMAVFQTQLTSLAPMLDKMNNFYFEKTHDDALFYHTNTLFLLLTIEKKIESQLQIADTVREADSALAYSYHTNEMDMLHTYTAQIQDALAAEEKRIEDNVNAETARTDANLNDGLMKQIKLSAPDATVAVQLKEMTANLAQIKLELEALQTQLRQMTNPPVARPL
jgi:hypothetical protein